MRLTAEQINSTLVLVREHLGQNVGVAVYGSRLDEQRKGGDLDLLLESEAPVSRLQRAGLKLALEARLNMPVDILVHQRGTAPGAFQAIALAEAVPLEQAA